MADLSKMSDAELLALLGDHGAAAPAKEGGILRNLGAGFVEGITSLPGLLYSINPISTISKLKEAGQREARGEGPNKVPLSAYMETAAPITKAINRGVEKVTGFNPENVSRESFPERLAYGVGAGATGGLIPGSGGYTVGRMLANAALGSISGAGAATGAEIAPEGWEVPASLAGAVLAPMAAVGTLNAAKAGYRALTTPKTVPGPEQTVGKLLTEAAGGIPEMAQAPLPGMRPTAGQVSGNQGLLSLERSAQQRSPMGAAAAAESRAAGNNAIMDAVESLGDVNADASATMLDRLEAARDASRKGYQAAWKQAGIEDTTPLAIAPLKDEINAFVGDLSRSGKSKIPSGLMDIFKDFGTTEPLRELQDWRSDLATTFREARMKGDANGMRILGALQDRVDDFLESTTKAAAGLSEEELARYDLARAATKEYKQTFAAPGSPVTTALNPKEFGSSAASNTANLFIKSGKGAGAPEALESYLKAVGNDPQALQAGRDTFAQKFKAAIMGAPDAQGNPTIKANAVTKFLDDYKHLTNSRLFSPDQRSLLDKIKRASEMAARTSRAGPAAGGSDTAAKLSGMTWADRLMERGVHHAGSSAGGFVGSFGASKLTDAIFAARREARWELLTQALYDPVLARTLMTNATKASAEKIPLPVQARIFSILLGTRQSANENSTRKVGP